MGACLSGGSSTPYIAYNDGGEEEFHARYLEDRILGEGEFGAVKLCHDMKNSSNSNAEPLAVKILKKGMTFKDNTLYSALKPETLQMECDILRALNGKCYCLGLKGIYETPRVIYVVTEICSGGEMMEYVSKQKELRTEDVSRIAFQLLSAIDHCAKHNVIHRDIKPENCMFRHPTPGAELRLIDFGSGTIDKSTPPPNTSDTLLQHTTFAGSAFYISPEMFQRTYTSKTDVWSAGVSLYVLVAGYPAESLQKAFNVLQQSNKQKRNLHSLPNLPSNLPESFYELLEMLCEYRHKVRTSAGDMLSHEFVQFHKGAGTPTTKKSRTPSVLIAGSVQRHTAFLDYQKFERAVTTLLATVLNREELERLLVVLEKKEESAAASTTLDVSVGGSVKQLTNAQKLKIIPMSELKKILLKDMKQKRCVEMMDKLPNADSYNTFAYHIALLKQFSRNNSVVEDGPSMKRSLSISGGISSSKDAPQTNSVHGNDVYGRLMKSNNNNKLGGGGKMNGRASIAVDKPSRAMSGW